MEGDLRCAYLYKCITILHRKKNRGIIVMVHFLGTAEINDCIIPNKMSPQVSSCTIHCMSIENKTKEGS